MMPVLNYQPCLNPLNAGLGFKDRNITFRHMANQISCYGVSKAPGAAFDYNDWQMAMLWDTLLLNIYGTTFNNVDTTVFRPLLTDVLQCQDNPTMTVFGPGDRAGRIGISVRDFARFGLLYLRQGNWNGTQLISQARALAAVTSPLSNSIPHTTAVAAEMCPGSATDRLGYDPRQSDRSRRQLQLDLVGQWVEPHRASQIPGLPARYIRRTRAWQRSARSS